MPVGGCEGDNCVLEETHRPGSQNIGTAHRSESSRTVDHGIAVRLVGLVTKGPESRPIGIFMDIEKNEISFDIVRSCLCIGRCTGSDENVGLVIGVSCGI